jgi:hypothetical protein
MPAGSQKVTTIHEGTDRFRPHEGSEVVGVVAASRDFVDVSSLVDIAFDVQLPCHGTFWIRRPNQERPCCNDSAGALEARRRWIDSRSEEPAPWFGRWLSPSATFVLGDHHRSRTRPGFRFTTDPVVPCQCRCGLSGAARLRGRPLRWCQSVLAYGSRGARLVAWTSSGVTIASPALQGQFRARAMRRAVTRRSRVQMGESAPLRGVTTLSVDAGYAQFQFR